ncbi:MAG: hypothetical protein PVG30_05935 [Gammaproteobacteria bacterium]|jgi:hypothetical protein
MKKIKWILFGLILLLPVVNAQPYQHTSAQRFLEICKQPNNMDVCRAYISGVLDGIFANYYLFDHHNLRVFTKNMRYWDEEKIRLGLLKWVDKNQKIAQSTNAAIMINQYLYSIYVKPSA